MLEGWNTERVMALAPDVESAKDAKKLAVPAKWALLGHDGYSVWGSYQGSGKAPYQVKIDLLKLQKADDNAAGLNCDCPSRKKPCKHLIGLLFIAVQTPAALIAGAPPEWVTEWLDKDAVRARKQQDKKKRGDKPADPLQISKTAAERREKIEAGLQEIELWLRNLIRSGLADPQVKTYAFWDAKAARMIDAQAPGLARWLREMGGLPAAGGDWLDPVLQQLGLLYLLIEGFKRFDTLSAGTQADIRTVLGWHLKREEIDPQDAVRDQWLVIGQRVTDEGERLRGQHVWLRGQHNGRNALILEFAFGDQPFDTRLTPGTQIDAELIFFPGSSPLRAFIHAQHESTQAIKPSIPVMGMSLLDNLTAYCNALTQNPWLPTFPFVLDAVYPTRYSGKWVLRDSAGAYLPLSSGFSHKWPLLALSGDHPIGVAGEWNGRDLWPLSAFVGVPSDRRFVDFSSIGKL